MRYTLQMLLALLKERKIGGAVPVTINGKELSVETLKVSLYCNTIQWHRQRYSRYWLYVQVGPRPSDMDFDLKSLDQQIPVLSDLPKIEISLSDLVSAALQVGGLDDKYEHLIDYCVCAETVPHARVKISINGSTVSVQLIIKRKKYFFPIKPEDAEKLRALAL
ncbi:MAG: hypothetical protein NT003_04125 [Candidatus Magasanikbacteria bacterium]|nr:hypothetical protein [Candidatus Magasanikbacteria bacterium]